MQQMRVMGLQGLAVTARSFRKLHPSATVVLCLVKLPGTVLGEVFLNPSIASGTLAALSGHRRRADDARQTTAGC